MRCRCLQLMSVSVRVLSSLQTAQDQYSFGWCLCNVPLPHLYDLKQTKLDLDVT